MGSTESSEGRRVSFGMDEEERVRVLQGIRLSENVVNRMKGSSQPSKAGQPTPPSPSGTSEGPEKDAKPPRSEHSGGRPAGVDEDVLKRYKQEQTMVQDELLQVATREREAATQHQRVSLQRGEGSVDQDKWRSDQLVRELESREAELRRRDTFYKEQLGRIERKNAEIYKLSSQQFHEAASKMEGMIRPRRLEPACSGLQAQILRCYRDHLQEVLLCSDLVKAYQRCVSAARKG
ncbi:MICOS complex subunit MIC25 isoform X1 [Equus przewalskii]|uniref:MICOS complex subunit MIC25 isoform X1 n=1 Tax=Equus przewalskii TaxID=9798 RepID=A0ABM4KWH1_EQUPR